jgi:acetylornithine/N-succinyldiaminopimelate aminotransferase
LAEARGRGLMLGVELAKGCDGPAVVDRMRELGVLANCTAGNVIRLLPPYVIEDEDLDRSLEVLLQAATEQPCDG